MKTQSAPAPFLIATVLALCTAAILTLCACSQQSTSNTTTNGSSGTAAQTGNASTPIPEGYKQASDTVSIEGTVATIDVDWAGGDVSVTSVPAEGVSFTATCDQATDGETATYYSFENRTLKICASNPDADVDIPDKNLVVNLPAGIDLSVVNVKTNGAPVSIYAPSVANVQAKTTTGNLDATIGSDLTSCSLTSTTGAVTLNAPQELGFNATCKTSGTLASSLGTTSDNGNGQKTVTNGAGNAKVTISSTSGNIAINAS